MNLHSTPDVLAATGLTERQIYYWVEHGAVAPTVPSPGTGHYMKWSDDDIARLKAILRFVNELKLFTDNVLTSTIAAVWADLVKDGVSHIELSFISIRIEPINP